MFQPTRAQMDVRDHEELDLLVVAPAGCGKTEALALRVAGMLERGVVSAPHRLLVTTFSNRARDNIQDRLRTYVPASTLRDRVTVSNFHGLSARVFRAHAPVIGLKSDMPLPESDWVREQCISWGWGWGQITAAERALRETKQLPLDDAEVRDSLEAKDAQGALLLERQRLTEGRLTYDDLPRLAELILTNDHVASLYRNHFRAVIVDEYQDLTPQQLRLIRRIGQGRTTYAGDLAQGIYGFAGAEPSTIDASIRTECTSVIEFNESHRSSPSVLRMVNAMNSWTGGLPLTSARPDSWPEGGLAAAIAFNTTSEEANWAVSFAAAILAQAPNQRIGIICRTHSRRHTVDAVADQSGLDVYRWDDGVLDSDTARLVKLTLLRIKSQDVLMNPDPLAHLRDVSGLDAVIEPDTRAALSDALLWCLEKLRDGLTPNEIRKRIRVGDEDTLLSAPGVHLLSGHVGKGQQFDWVVVVGAEDGVVPFFQAKADEEVREEARVLSVMLSRARHGVVVTCAGQVPDSNGRVWRRAPSRFIQALNSAAFLNRHGVEQFLSTVNWHEVARR